MNYMIYIAKSVEENFKQESNKSGLINDLLLNYYNRPKSSDTKRHYPERFPYKKTKERTPAKRDYLECKNGHPLVEGRNKCLAKGCKYSIYVK